MVGGTLLFWLFLGLSCVSGYEVPVTDTDYSRQVCSGMWGGHTPYINVSFDDASQGQLSVVIYEWKDMEYLGKVTSMTDDSLPKTYVCTSDAVRAGFCDTSGLGKFILDLPQGKSMEHTSFWSARVGFPPKKSSAPTGRQEKNGTGGTSNVLWYTQPIQYPVRQTGYYCVAIVPVTVLSTSKIRQTSTDVPFHPSYNGVVLFRNTFDGQLPATDYPKVNFYFSMFLAYAVLGGVWGWLCYKHAQELLPIQYYLSSLIGLVNVEMLANWAYYRYLNAHGNGVTSTVFLFVVAILDAGRNALSFFLLLVVSLGLSVVRETLGSIMMRCQLLAGAHFVFGVLYAVGIVELELESTSALVLLLFVIPLAFTLSGFLLWIMYALNGTIAQLAARKQTFKLGMFKTLHRILLVTVLIILAFFVVSSLSFSSRLAEDYAANTWKVRWWLLDGWLALLYLAAFSAIAYLWRPTGNNRRLQMSDELAQDEEDAEDYDLESLERRTAARREDDDDEATLVGRREPGSMQEDAVVFEIGDEEDGHSDDEDKESHKKRTGDRHGGSIQRGDREDERDGLITNGGSKGRDE